MGELPCLTLLKDINSKLYLIKYYLPFVLLYFVQEFYINKYFNIQVNLNIKKWYKIKL
jgi:hypothetical protein